ncbi:MAG: hypothetical protein WCY01_03245 [Alkalispirochaeta sp.]|jgi:hypothetical protein
MGFTIIVLLSVGLGIAVVVGRRFNRTRAQLYIRILEEQFSPVAPEYVTLGRELGYGFEYNLDGPVDRVEGILTLLPRYAPLYLPIARMLGRQDLLKLTFHFPGTLPAGVGALVHTNCTVSRWSSVEHDDDWREETVEQDGQVYTLYYYNPIIAERLRSILPKISEIKNLNQITLDSRRNSVTVFVTPQQNWIKLDVERVAALVFSLTAA